MSMTTGLADGDTITIQGDPTLLSCSEDDTVRWFDLMTKCVKEDTLINTGEAITAISLNSVFS